MNCIKGDYFKPEYSLSLAISTNIWHKGCFAVYLLTFYIFQGREYNANVVKSVRKVSFIASSPEITLM